jgi:hypothetical protein
MRATLLLAVLALTASAEELSGTQLAKIKDATVYVKHVGFRGLETGRADGAGKVCCERGAWMRPHSTPAPPASNTVVNR